MNSDDAFLKELQKDDEVRVIVNIFGQEMPFEGICTGITDDKLSILTSAKPEPVELPLSAILKGIITRKNKINIEESSEDNTYENIEIKYPDVVYGYYIVDLNKKSQPNDCTNNTNEFDIFDTPTAIILSLREFSSNYVIKKLYNSNAYDLDNKKSLDTLYINNKDQRKDVNELYNEYVDSFDIFINKEAVHENNTLFYYLKNYLATITSLNQIYYYFPFENKEAQSYTNDKYFDSIIQILTIFIVFNENITEENIKQYRRAFIDTLFKYHLTLKLFFKTSLSQLLGKYNNNSSTDFFINFLALYLSSKEIDIIYKDNQKYSNLRILLEKWYTAQVKKHNLFNPECFQSETLYKSNFDKYVLIPLLSLNNSPSESTKHTLINFLYSLYTSEGKLLYIKVSNDEMRNNLTDYIKTKYNLDNDLDLSIKTIFNQFTKTVDSFFLYIIEICKAFVKIEFYDKDKKTLYKKINKNANSIVLALTHEAESYITVTTKFNNRLKLFFKRVAAISSPVDDINFSKAEEQLLLNYQNCSELIKESSEEIFSGSIKFYLDFINEKTHSKYITSDFYSKFTTVINVFVNKQAISCNRELNRIFIPIQISNSKHGQTSVILKICTQSSFSDKINNDLQANIKLLPDSHIFYLAEFSYNDFETVVNGFNIYITLRYKFKTAWDFEKCEATWKSQEISESFCIQDEPKHLAEFHEIRNLFRDYSSGSVIKNDRMFFGRALDIKHVIENIRDESGRIVTNRCVCIYGQTRTGKSSLLYHIKKKLRLSPSNIIVDIGDIGSAGASEAGIKYRILSCLLDEIEVEHDDICNLITNAGISMTADPERNKNDESYFTEQIGKIRSILKRKAKDTQIIILIDEFTYVYDWIKEKKLSENFMKFWKAFITNYDICAIIVGQDHMMKFINDQRFTNAFGAIRTWEVNYLKEPDACKLVTMPVSDSPDYAGPNGCTILPEAVNLLVEMTSGSAYLLMNICADFIDYLNERHALTATSGHAEDFLRKNISSFEERWFEPLFNDKSEMDSDASITANKELLKKLALSYSEHSGVIEDELSLSEEEKERLHSLEARRVVEMNDGRWRITVRLYAEWLRNKFGSR